jgi:hypothetical protein
MSIGLDDANPYDALPRVFQAQPLDSAADTAAVLTSRLRYENSRSPGPLPGLPPAPAQLAQHPEWGSLLRPTQRTGDPRRRSVPRRRRDVDRRDRAGLGRSVRRTRPRPDRRTGRVAHGQRSPRHRHPGRWNADPSRTTDASGERLVAPPGVDEPVPARSRHRISTSACLRPPAGARSRAWPIAGMFTNACDTTSPSEGGHCPRVVVPRNGQTPRLLEISYLTRG